jgi:hypothetical protein
MADMSLHLHQGSDLGHNSLLDLPPEFLTVTEARLRLLSMAQMAKVDIIKVEMVDVVDTGVEMIIEEEAREAMIKREVVEVREEDAVVDTRKTTVIAGSRDIK